MYLFHYSSIIDLFLNDKNNKKYLLINGLPGTGKTTLADYIFKDTIPLKIDSSQIRYHKNINEYIHNIISKNNITLMFTQPKKRTLIIDNLDVFKLYDKPNYRHLLRFIDNNTTIKLIVITNKYNNLKLNNIRYTINTNIIPNIIKDINPNISVNQAWTLIKKYDSNLHKIIQYLETYNSQCDAFFTTEKIIEKIFEKKINIFNISEYIDTNDTMIILSLLELIIYNIPLNYNTKYIRNIYNNYIYADIYEKIYYKTNIKFVREFALYLSCCNNIYINNKTLYINNKSFNIYNSKSSIICQQFYKYEIIAKILHNIYLSYIENNMKLLIYYKKTYRKYNRVLKDIYKITF